MQKEIALVIATLLERCSVVPRVVPVDDEFVQQCLDDAVTHGLSLDESSPGTPSFRRFVIGGASLAFIGYGHIECLETKKYIALSSALAIYIEDLYKDAPELVNEFTNNFYMHQVQKSSILQAFDRCLRETSKYFDAAQTNLIITSTLNFVTSISLEHALETVDVSPKARQFPGFLRGLSASALSYAIFLFPKAIPLELYMQAMPSMMGFISHMNDVLSFYKEQLDGEGNNYISTLAFCRGCSKLKVLQELADSVASDFRTTVDILALCPPALQAWKSFASGFARYHLSSKRYRLEEIVHMELSSDA